MDLHERLETPGMDVRMVMDLVQVLAQTSIARQTLEVDQNSNYLGTTVEEDITNLKKMKLIHRMDDLVWRLTS